MASKIQDKDSEIEKQTALVSEKVSAIDAAKSSLEEKEGAFIAIENKLMQATEEIKAKKEALQTMDISFKAVQDKLLSAQGKLTEISSLRALFDAIVEGGELAVVRKEEAPTSMDVEGTKVEETKLETVPETV